MMLLAGELGIVRPPPSDFVMKAIMARQAARLQADTARIRRATYLAPVPWKLQTEGSAKDSREIFRKGAQIICDWGNQRLALSRNGTLWLTDDLGLAERVRMSPDDLALILTAFDAHPVKAKEVA